MPGCNDVRDISAWKLAHQLRLRVDLFLCSPDFRGQYKFCEELAAAARLGPGHIADGHNRLRHKDYSRLVREARRAEAQVLRHLVDAHEQCLITDDELIINRQLTRRAMSAATGLIRDLESTPDSVAPAR